MSAVEKSNSLDGATGDVGGGVGVVADAGASKEKLAGVSNEKPPNGASLGGGVGIFLAFALPMLGGLAVIQFGHPPAALRPHMHDLDAYWSGMRERTPFRRETPV